jgi:hypothetical protein
MARAQKATETAFSPRLIFAVREAAEAAGRRFAKGFCAFAKALRAARLGGYAVLLWMKGMRPVFRNPKAYGLTPNTCPNLPRNFNPTEPTVKRLNAKIVEGLRA